MIGFSLYVQACLAWDSGLTTVWCYKCRAFSAVLDCPADRTFRCSRLPMHDLLEQPGHLSAFKADEQDDTDSA